MLWDLVGDSLRSLQSCSKAISSIQRDFSDTGIIWILKVDMRTFGNSFNIFLRFFLRFFCESFNASSGSISVCHFRHQLGCQPGKVQWDPANKTLGIAPMSSSV